MFSWYPDYEELLAQTQLVLFMLGMGANLTVGDFAQVLKQPRSFISAAIGQILFSPFVALGIIRFLMLSLWRPTADSPTEAMLKDPWFLLDLAAAAATILAVIYA